MNQPYRFTATNPDGTPARWDRCTTHRVVLDLRHAPGGALAALRLAFARADRLSGLRFRLTVLRTSRPGAPRWLHQFGAAPGDWPPITVRWAPLKGPLTGDIAVTRPIWVANRDSRYVFVTATITFNVDFNDAFHSQTPAGISLISVSEHEVGHVMGLDHVSDARELMFPSVRRGDYGAGDREGLRRLGAGACLTVPARPSR